MSLVAIVSLLQTALLLLTLVSAHPELPQSMRDTATQVAQQAIAQATTAISATTQTQPCVLQTYPLIPCPSTTNTNGMGIGGAASAVNTTRNPVAFWNFDETSGPALDVSGNGNVGVLEN